MRYCHYIFDTAHTQLSLATAERNAIMFSGIVCTKAPFTLLRFCTKTETENLRFCESVHTDPHKNDAKTEVFENAVKSGYPQKRRF